MFFYFSWLLIAGIGGAARAEDFALFDRQSLVSNQQISKPPQVISKRDLLYIGLQPYLGRSDKDLQLISAGKNLILKDGHGIVHKSSEINIGWKKIPLIVPQKIIRNVAGPFPSFESAQEFASKLEKIGIQSDIAHPKDWEVWVDGAIQIPEKIDFKKKTELITFVIRPILKGRNLPLALQGPIIIEAPEGLIWKTGIYKGPFLLIPDSYGTWTFVEKVFFKDYLNGVVPHEIGAGSPSDALSAQAILARTWALANINRFEIDGYHLCSDVQCQVYKDPNKASNAVQQAIKVTSGKFLSWEGKPIHAVYHASNGGVMASAEEAWSMYPLPYLRATVDGSINFQNRFPLPLQSNFSIKTFLSKYEGAYGTSHYLFRWKRILPASKIIKALNTLHPDMQPPKKLKVLTRGPSGRVLDLAIIGSQDEVVEILSVDNIRRIFRDLPSTLFIIDQLYEGVWQFSGGGFGHGVGLSQAGAIELAERGWNTNQILMHYYPGTVFKTLP